MKAFIDSSFFIALADRSDGYFTDAQDCIAAQINEGTELITSNAVLSETITWIRYHVGFEYARAFGEGFRNSKLIKIIWADQQLEKFAWKTFLKYSDKELSHTDCLSFACMKERNIKQALTFDRHFQQTGFTMLPERD